MSLAIDVDRVTHVLLADGWHAVAARTFTLDTYEYIWHSPHTAEDSFTTLHGGGNSGVCATGFSFEVQREAVSERDVTKYLAGPLTAILAVRYARA